MLIFIISDIFYYIIIFDISSNIDIIIFDISSNIGFLNTNTCYDFIIIILLPFYHQMLRWIRDELQSDIMHSLQYVLPPAQDL